MSKRRRLAGADADARRELSTRSTDGRTPQRDVEDGGDDDETRARRPRAGFGAFSSPVPVGLRLHSWKRVRFVRRLAFDAVRKHREVRAGAGACGRTFARCARETGEMRRVTSSSTLERAARCVTNAVRGGVATRFEAATSCSGVGDSSRGSASTTTTTTTTAPARRWFRSSASDFDDEYRLDVYDENMLSNRRRTIVPWTRQVVSGVELLRSGKYNKGMSFSEDERDRLNLRGLLPPAIFDQSVQVERVISRLRRVSNDVEKHAWLNSLYERNERLFYRVVRDHLEELLPVLSAPTIWQVCAEFGLMYRRPRGLYISIKDRGSVYRILKNWPVRNVKAVVLTDGQRVTGLGDLGVQGMGMAVGKTTLFTALGGLDPADVLPICIDVGTNNTKLLEDKFYIGLRQKRKGGDDYYDLIDEVVYGLKRRFGPRVVVCFEEFSNRNTKKLLDKYNSNSVAYCDDLQGIAATTLASIISALPQMGGSLRDQRFLFAGAGETGAHCADLLATYISQEHGITLPEARKNIYFIDRKGLVTRSRAENEDDLELHKLPYAHDIEGCGSSVMNAVEIVKPTALIGVRRHRFSFFEGSVLKDDKLFTDDVLRAMAQYSERPLIMALSRPSALHECTAQEAYEATGGKCIFVGGCHSKPFEYKGKTIAPSECSTEYIFPGFGLGLAIAEATHVRDSLLIAAAEAVADQTSSEDIERGAVFPRKREIPEISAHVAARVASKAFANGLSALPNKPMDWLRLAKSWMFDPSYRPYTP